jgi:hypothetical protein
MDLSSEHDKRNCESVGGPFATGFAVEGEKATAYTGPAWPTKRRDDEICLSGSGSVDCSGLPSRVHTRIYDSAMPAAIS